MTSRRSMQSERRRESRALQFIPGHLGGRVASAQPVSRVFGISAQTDPDDIEFPASITFPFDETTGTAAYDPNNPGADPLEFTEGVQWEETSLAGDAGTAVKLAAAVSGTHTSEISLDGAIELDVWIAGVHVSGATDVDVVSAGPIKVNSTDGDYQLAIHTYGTVGTAYTPATATTPVHVIASYDTDTGAWEVSFNGSSQSGTTTATGAIDPVVVRVEGGDNQTTFDNLTVTGDLTSA